MRADDGVDALEKSTAWLRHAKPGCIEGVVEVRLEAEAGPKVKGAQRGNRAPAPHQHRTAARVPDPQPPCGVALRRIWDRTSRHAADGFRPLSA